MIQKIRHNTSKILQLMQRLEIKIIEYEIKIFLNCRLETIFSEFTFFSRGKLYEIAT